MILYLLHSECCCLPAVPPCCNVRALHSAPLSFARRHVDEWAIPVEALPQAVAAIQDMIAAGGHRVHFPVEVRVWQGEHAAARLHALHQWRAAGTLPAHACGALAQQLCCAAAHGAAAARRTTHAHEHASACCPLLHTAGSLRRVGRHLAVARDGAAERLHRRDHVQAVRRGERLQGVLQAVRGGAWAR